MKKLVISPVLLLILIAACTPLVPYDQVNPDLYGSSQNARATANAALYQAQMQEQMLTMTAEAPIIRITETAAALQMQQQLWTATAQSAMSTQVAAVTATAQSVQATATIAKLNADNQILANNLERDRLELERQRDSNDFWGKSPIYSFGILVLVLAAYVITHMRRLRYQTAKVDARGNVLPILDVVDGHFTDIDRSPNYRGPVSEHLPARALTAWVEKKFGMMPLLPAVTPSRQDATTERDQMVDLATRGLPGPSSENKEQKKLAGQEMMKQLSASNLQSRFKILDGATSDLGVINGEVIEVLDQDWKEADKK